MITITPIKLNSNIPFKNNSKQDMAILSLQSPAAKQNFEKDYFAAVNADAVQRNPLSAIGWKFAKTYKLLFPENPEPKPEPVKNLKHWDYYPSNPF